MSDDNSGTTLERPVASNDFGSAGVSESPFGQDGGAGGKPNGGAGGATFAQQAGSIREQATEKLHSLADEGKNQVVASLDGLVTAAREIAGKLQDGAFGPVGGYATAAADTLQGWTDTIKNRSVTDLIDDGRDLVRKSPSVAIGAAVAAGFVVSRMLKAGNPSRYSA